MEIQIAVAKVSKFGSMDSGDTLEFVERPNGGFSIVMVDARSSGRPAKYISTLVVRKAINLLAEGVRDGAAARAASDFLFTEKSGTASAFLNILSVDLQTSTIVVCRNNPTPVFIHRREHVECMGGEAKPIGLSRNIKPAITEIPLETGITIVMYTDGLQKAGEAYGQPLDVCMLLEGLLDDQEPPVQEIANTVLQDAIRTDQHRPNDDMSVVVLQVLGKASDTIRNMTIRVPVDLASSIGS